MYPRVTSVIFAIVLLMSPRGASSAQNAELDVPDRYLSQTTPGARAQVFARAHFPGWIHTTPVFSPDFSEMFWDDEDVLMSAVYENGKWSSSRAINLSDNQILTADPYLSPDNTRPMYHLYLSKKINGEWMEAERVYVFEDRTRSAISPIISPEGKYLFFMAWTSSGDHRAHWIEADAVLKPLLN